VVAAFRLGLEDELHVAGRFHNSKVRRPVHNATALMGRRAVAAQAREPSPCRACSNMVPSRCRRSSSLNAWPYRPAGRLGHGHRQRRRLPLGWDHPFANSMGPPSARTVRSEPMIPRLASLSTLGPERPLVVPSRKGRPQQPAMAGFPSAAV
jgi:hypothetical protein